MNSRHLTGAVLVGALVLTAGGMVAWQSAGTERGSGTLDLARTGTVVTVTNGTQRVEQSTRDGKHLADGPACTRAAAAAGTLACLYGLPGPFSSEVRVYRTGRAKPTLTLPVWGEPSRTRVSPSGNLVAWTVFRSGDSYLQQGRFSTTAGFYDLRDGTHVGSLEDFAVTVEGHRYRAEDRNFWGITFAADDRTFYVTMASKGSTRLMRGDLRKRSLVSVREKVECPSLSPDGTRIAYKKRVHGDRWRLHVLDLRTHHDTPLAERAHLDDQPAWLDNATIAYARRDGDGSTVFTVPADGSGAPGRLVRGSSPSVTTDRDAS
ncbi:PD40 domain-containing protein [Streptomyces sp. NA04227]|uniref:TolB family protein n=1 Tax=Streptomyces sp. NA04227 TaxID=2742136 RepID=UPI001591531C|nr:PD40 domain-containing protein [Streptomyces sp. NA04227]QKW06329.1 PD40 domain-containing protein [Streptomyces sp. NA04227]